MDQHVLPLQKPTPMLLLDIDGTVRQGKDDDIGRFVNCAADVRVFYPAVRMMQKWKARGGRIIGISNQGGIALGIVDQDDVLAAMNETHRQTGYLFDKLAWCSHHPDATDPTMARCWCRKPKPGLAIEAMLDLAKATGETYPPHLGLFVGDRPEDLHCATQLDFDFQWAADWRALA